MTVSDLLTRANSYELTCWTQFLEARAERQEEARKRAAYDRQYE